MARQFDVNKAMSKMNKFRKDYQVKGTAGEEAVLALLQNYQSRYGGTIFHSFEYEYSKKRDGSNYPGNVKYQDGKFIEISGNASTRDEIDLLYVTQNRIFVIECKARSGKWNFFDHWAKQQGKMVDKSPIAQSEKHARHLYYLLYEYLPDGKPEYIVPITVFVDKVVIEDARSAEYKNYITVAIINNFIKKLSEEDTPLKYRLMTDKVVERLKRNGTNSGVY